MGKLWGNMDFYVETGNFVDFLSTFWHFLLGFSLFFPAFFLFFSCFAVLLFLFYRHIQFQEINVAVFS